MTLLDADTGTARRFVYLRAREVMTVSAIAPCHCRLFFAMGNDWDALTEEFREDSSYAVFDDPLRFTESEADSGVEYVTFSVTLHPVPEGRAKTTRLSKEEFERQLGKRHSRKGVSDEQDNPKVQPRSPSAGRFNLSDLFDRTDEQGRLKAPTGPTLQEADALFARRPPPIPFTPGRPIYVDAVINGSKRARLILDTGADRTTIAPRVLRAAGLAPRGRAMLRGVTGQATADVYDIASLEVGLARVGQLTVFAHDAGQPGSDGLLGRDFLDHFKVTIDNAAGQVTLSRK